MFSPDAEPTYFLDADAEAFPESLSPGSSNVDIEEVAREWPRIAIVQKFLGIAKALGFCAGAATLIQFVLLCCSRGPSLHLSDTNFLEDVNASTWRNCLFSFDSDVLFDSWTPFVMGLIAVLVHFRSFRCLAITGNWIRFGLWNLALALFGNFGYCGLFGILVGVVSMSAALLSFVLFLFHAGPAHLWPNNKLYLSTSRLPPWYSVGAGFWPSEGMYCFKRCETERPCRPSQDSSSAPQSCAHNRKEPAHTRLQKIVVRSAR